MQIPLALVSLGCLVFILLSQRQYKEKLAKWEVEDKATDERRRRELERARLPMELKDYIFSIPGNDWPRNDEHYGWMVDAYEGRPLPEHVMSEIIARRNK